jgi:hypothetical protein
MADTVISKHHQDDTPLHRNSMPVAECDVHEAKVAGKTCKAIDVPILSCANVWLRVQKEAEKWITTGGKLIADPIARNRRINQAYAQLWLEDSRFQWAGLAAFASKQVGCGMLHAADNIRKSQEEITANAGRPDISSNTESASADVVPAIIAGASAYMYRQLALGNTALFLDIYPLHRFYQLRGLENLKRCLNKRSDITKSVIWPIEKRKLAFGTAFPAILDGFESIDRGAIAKSVGWLAFHEQVNILQAVIYNDFAMRRALDANQFSWAIDFPSGLAAEIALTLSAECKIQSGPLTISFPREKTAKLYDKDQRMKFVYAAAARFNSLLRGDSRATVQTSIAQIARDGAKS